MGDVEKTVQRIGSEREKLVWCRDKDSHGRRGYHKLDVRFGGGKLKEDTVPHKLQAVAR